MSDFLRRNERAGGQRFTGYAAGVCAVFLLVFSSAGAQAKTDGVVFSNPETIGKPFGYTHVVDVKGAHRTVYISGQLGLDKNGKLVGEAGDFRAQATQAFENIKAALDSVGAGFDDIVKMNMYLTDISAHLPLLREVSDTYVNTSAPPASTTVGVTKLALPGALFEIEAIVVLPPRP